MNCAKRLSWVWPWKKTVIDLLHDTGQTEQAVGVVEIEIVDPDAGALGVVIDELTAREHAGCVARLAAHQLHGRRVSGFDPVGEGVAQIHQRVAQRGQFPVEHADDLHRVVGVEDHIVEAVVVVHDAGGGVVGRHLVVEPCTHRFPAWGIGGQGFFVAVAPAANLALYVAFRLAQVGQAAGAVIDLVQFNELVDKAFAQGFGPGRIQAQLRRQVGAQNNPVDPFHYIELGADHRLIGAMHIGFGAIGKAVFQLVENAVLAAHVMGRLGLVAKRRAPQHEFLAWVFEQVSQVRRATGELADVNRAAQARNVGLEVGIDQAGIKFFAWANLGRLVVKRHAYPFCLF